MELAMRREEEADSSCDLGRLQHHLAQLATKRCGQRQVLLHILLVDFPFLYLRQAWLELSTVCSSSPTLPPYLVAFVLGLFNLLFVLVIWTDPFWGENGPVHLPPPHEDSLLGSWDVVIIHHS